MVPGVVMSSDAGGEKAGGEVVVTELSLGFGFGGKASLCGAFWIRLVAKKLEKEIGVCENENHRVQDGSLLLDL
ncbi:hypothetical protein L1049_020781 [Liquidambar formosana]|uniref:Uncharacterized protein n=1 Tax=Liquidambar formosana TaxID=63359 RepID=A0AAP0SDL2_LIQFO